MVNLQDFILVHKERIWGDLKHPEVAYRNLDKIQQWFYSSTLVHKISTERIENMMESFKLNGLSNATINRHLATLSKLLDHAAYIGVITNKPMIRYLKEPIGRERTITSDELNRLCAHFQEMGSHGCRQLTLFLLHTGCRLSEAFNLQLEDVRPTSATFRNTKNGTTRVVPLTAMAQTMIRANIHTGTKPFSYLQPIYRQHWKKAQKSIGLEDDLEFVPHMLRHTCATRLVQSGVGLPQVMKWMGHKSINTTMRYAHLQQQDLVDAVGKLEEALKE